MSNLKKKVITNEVLIDNVYVVYKLRGYDVWLKHLISVGMQSHNPNLIK